MYREDRRLLGVHIVGTGATELIHIGQAVLGLQGRLDYFLMTAMNYPTLAECYKVAALDAHNKLSASGGGPLVPRLRASPVASSFLDGVNVASLALMAVVTFQLGRAALVDLPTAGIALVSALLLLRLKVNATFLIAGGALVGWTVHQLGALR